MGKTCVCGADALDVDVDGDGSPSDGHDRRRGRRHLHRRHHRPGLPRRGAGRARPGGAVLRGRPRPATADDPLVARRAPAADARRRSRAGWRCAPTPTPARTRPGPAASAPQGIGLCRTEHMFLGDRRELVERLILADRRRSGEAALAALLPLQRADFVEHLPGDGRPAGHHPADRPAAARVPAAAGGAGRAGRPRRGARRGPRPRRGAARRGAPDARAEPDARPARRAPRPGRSPACSRCRSGRSPRPPRSCAAEGGDPRPEIMVPLVGAVQELETVRAEAEQILAERGRRRRRRGA